MRLLLLTSLLGAGAGGMRGEGVLTYRPDHPNYAAVRAHVGPIEPGEVWPDEAPAAPQP